MNPRRLFLYTGALLVAVLAGILAYHRLASRVTPPGQPPLVELSSYNMGDLRDQFNEYTDGPRILVMLSPT
jgi:hypothetical protein